MLRLARLACLAGAFALAGPAFSQTVSQVTPTAAAVGSTLTIDGTGFGTAKPKVQLVDGATGKKYSLKVVDSTDTKIHATITKAVEGHLQLQVLVKGAAAPANSPANISIERPLVTSLSTSSAEPNAPLTVFGDFFGIKPGTVLINGQKAKVVSWVMNEIHLLMPKKLPNGFFKLAVDNKLGVDDDATIHVTGSALKLGKAGLKMTLDGVSFPAKFTPSGSTPTLHVIGGSNGSNPAKLVLIKFPYDATVQDPQVTIPVDPAFALFFTFTQTSKFNIKNPMDPNNTASTWFAQPGSFTFTVVSESGGQIQADFDGTLVRQAGSVGNPTIHAKGSVIVDL